MNREQREKLILDIAEYMISTKATIRQTASKFMMSKSTVHKYCVSDIAKINYTLYLEVNKVINENKEQRCARGGAVTKQKNIDDIKAFANEVLNNLNNI